jgi:hypothetical protein
VEIDIANERVPGGVAVRVQVRLSARETNRLFLSGDTLIQLPLDGALPEPDGVPIPRSSIFLSELAGSRDGLARVFADDEAAEAFATVVRTQLETALEAS